MQTKEIAPTLTVIDGGKADLERKKWLLFNQPWALDLDEFERMAELCGLTRAEEFDLMLERMRHRAHRDIEARYLLAVFEGRKTEAERLGKLLERRKALGLRLMKSPISQQKGNDDHGATSGFE
ncbi:MAG: hypothetical protein ACOY6N_09495 [Pseudomonadota bacterium]|jgi:hypothetical protein